MTAEDARQGVRALLAAIGEDPDREGLRDTPDRVVRAYAEMTCGTSDPARLLGRVFTDSDYPTDEMIAVGPIPFTSLCEHHLWPFTGHAWVAYVPSEEGGIVGLSKIPRLVEHYARALQVQERLTTQVADALMEHTDAQGAACVIRAHHSCMSARGVRNGAAMTTSVLRGVFFTVPEARAEFLALTRP